MANEGTEIAAVLFDADGVVQRTAPGFAASLAALCPDPAYADDFIADVFAAERPCLTGAGDFGASLDDVLRRWECACMRDDALRVWTLIEPDPGVLALARRLRRQGIRTGLATNQQHHRAAFMTRELDYGAVFDHLFYSCEIGHAKPSPDYFEAVLAALDLDAASVLFIDDHRLNVDAARAAGLAAFVYQLDQGLPELERRLTALGLVPGGVGDVAPAPG